MLNTLLTRRFSSRAVEQTQSIIVFQLGQHGFGLPIAAVRRVIPLEHIHGDRQQQPLRLARHLDQEVVVLDVKLCLFSSAATVERTDAAQGREYLLLLDSSAEEQMGLPIESEPQILRLPESAFSSLPETYRRLGNIRCLSNRMATVEGRSPILLLEAETLVQTYLDWLATHPLEMPAQAVELMDRAAAGPIDSGTEGTGAAIPAVVEPSLAELTEATPEIAAFSPAPAADPVAGAVEQAILTDPAETTIASPSASALTPVEDLPNPAETDPSDWDLFMASLPEPL
jgi:chemotaxis signal transduction protein